MRDVSRCGALGAVAILAVAGLRAQDLYKDRDPDLPQRIFAETEEERVQRMAWWTHDRFGMFIHFGLYSKAARHEWVKATEHTPDAEYDEKYFTRFNPDLFDAREWVRSAKAAGMKYIVLTTKHHEGFCLWDSAVTDYKITKTPFGRDLVREYVDACHAEGVRVGFYYSVIDWHHPDYTTDRSHPRNEDDDAKWQAVNKDKDMAKYRKYMFAQIRELMTNYGKVDIAWFDFTPKGAHGKSWRDWDSVNLIKMVRQLQPGIIVNSRLDLMDTDDGWDFVAPEQVPVSSCPTVRGRRVPWEVCHTFSGSWGYYRDEATWKSPLQLVQILIGSVAAGGNLIMNVGPTGRGNFDKRARERLSAYGEWMRFNSRSIYGCTIAPTEFKAPDGTMLTWNPQTKLLYVHLLEYPSARVDCPFWEKVSYAQFLHDESEVLVVPPPKQTDKTDGYQPNLTGGFKIPVIRPDVLVPVIEVFLKK